jgi:GNAT superfamily N-acetyltransferase
LSGPVRIRAAERTDVEQIFAWIRELAEYERAPDAVTGSPELLREALFGERPVAEAVMAELDGSAVGFAVFHSTFSTWECRPGIWLEDLYVPEAHRRSGVGLALLSWLARTTLERGCARLEWAALDWNTPALRFYEKLGATRLHDWDMHRLDGSTLARVAEGAGRASARGDG